MSRLAPILFFQQFSSPIFDSIALLLANYADLLFIVSLALVYWCIDRRKGEVLGYGAVTNMLFSIFVKDLLKLPRPIGHPDIRTLAEESAPGFSFPSTHTQIFSNLTGMMALIFKKKSLTLVFAALTVLMGISRMYLGVHYLADVLGGILFGLLIAVACHYLATRISNRNALYGATAVLAALFLFFRPSAEYTMIFLGLLAFWCGTAFERRFVKFEATGTPLRKTVRFILGIVILLILHVGLKQLPLPAELCDAIRYMVIVFTAMGLYPLLFTKIKL